MKNTFKQYIPFAAAFAGLVLFFVLVVFVLPGGSIKEAKKNRETTNDPTGQSSAVAEISTGDTGETPATVPLADDVTPIPTAATVATATPVLTATPTPMSTATPVPTATPTPMSTATPTPMPTATPVPTATLTPMPTATPVPETTAEPTAEPTAETTAAPIAGGQREMCGIVVVLDPGHGGNQPGTYATNPYTGETVYEKDINMKLALYCKEYLENNFGIRAVLTRDGDYNLNSDLRTDLYNRVVVGVDNGASYVVSLHCNALPSNSTQRGYGFYYPVSEPNHTYGANMASQLRAAYASTGLRDDGDHCVWDYENNYEYYALNRKGVWTGMPTLIIEHAYMTNPADLECLLNDDFLHKMAYADAKGIAAYFGQTE